MTSQLLSRPRFQTLHSHSGFGPTFLEQKRLASVVSDSARRILFKIIFTLNAFFFTAEAKLSHLTDRSTFIWKYFQLLLKTAFNGRFQGLIPSYQ